MPLDISVGERIRTIRRQRGVTQTVLSDLVRRSERWLIDVEQGRADPRLSDLEALAAALRVDVSTLLRNPSTAPDGPSLGDDLGGRMGPRLALRVEVEDAGLTYHDGVYQLRIRREIVNTSDQRLTRYFVRIAVDRYPHDPEKSRQHYRSHPLTWDELNFSARCAGEPIGWTVKQDQDSGKELYLRFETAEGRSLALAPGESIWIDYGYRVGEDKWGPFFVRAIRWPTRHLRVRLNFPRASDPLVWGTQLPMTGERDDLALPTSSIHRRDDGATSTFEWTTTNPPLHARYRLEWRLFGEPALLD
jgi:transcriptional regulator with XRE-family HTH domain